MAGKLTFEQQQAKLDLLPGLKFYDKVLINSLADVIYYLIFANAETYLLDNKKQYTGKSRSAQDCYIIAKYYLPNITWEQVFKALRLLSNYSDLKAQKKVLLSSWYCPDVSRVVHQVDSYPKASLIQLNNYLTNSKRNYEKIQAEEAVSRIA